MVYGNVTGLESDIVKICGEEHGLRRGTETVLRDVISNTC